jgi:pentatricopeptide repeat protein
MRAEWFTQIRTQLPFPKLAVCMCIRNEGRTEVTITNEHMRIHSFTRTHTHTCTHAHAHTRIQGRSGDLKLALMLFDEMKQAGYLTSLGLFRKLDTETRVIGLLGLLGLFELLGLHQTNLHSLTTMFLCDCV